MSHFTFRARRAAAMAATVALSTAVVFAAPASAHDSVVSSNPEANAQVAELPEQITLTFSAEPQEGFNTIALSRDGEVLTTETPKMDHRDLTIDVPEDIDSEPGNYTVGYQITSSDGHATRGSYEFSVEGASEGESGQGDTRENTQPGDKNEDTTGVPSWLLPLGGIVVVAAALVMAIMRFRGMKDD